MFDFLKFLEVGNTLAGFDGEEYMKSAIGRYYYSVFGSARMYLIFTMGESDFRKYGDIHSEVCDRLIKSDDSTESVVGETLAVLGDLRNLADYDWNDTNPNFFRDKINFAKKESELALMQIESLKKSPPFNV